MNHAHLLASLALAAVTFSPSLLALPVSHGPQLASAPDVILNEIMFDGPGPAGVDGSWQWVELAIVNQTKLDETWTLHDSQGSLLCSLPSVSLPAGSFVVVFLGPKNRELENLNPKLGAIQITSAQDWGDHLGVKTGGVQLKHQGVIQDELYWGGASGQPHLELGLASGNILEEAESLGRNAASFYSGSASDWAVAGGANANGSSGGLANIVELPDESYLVLHQDTMINSIMMALSLSETDTGWLHVVDSQPETKSYGANFEDRNKANVVVKHVFDITINGIKHTLSGLVGTTFTRETGSMSTSELYETSGRLVSSTGQYSLDLETSEYYSGAHQTTRKNLFSTKFTWNDGANQYPVETSASITTTWVGDDVKEVLDSRTSVDFGGAGTKTAIAEITQTRIADGFFTSEAVLVRSYPSVLPKAEGATGTQSWSSGEKETLLEDLTVERDGFGLFRDVKINRYEQYLGSALWAKLQAGSVGGATYRQSSVSDHVDNFDVAFSLPLVNADGVAIEHSLAVNGTYTRGPEKELTEMTLMSTSGGQSMWAMKLTIDPPVNDVPVSPRVREKSTWEKVKTAGITVATCAGASVLSTITLQSYAGKKAAIALVGKGLAKKLVPGIGWVVAGACTIRAIGDWFGWGSDD